MGDGARLDEGRRVLDFGIHFLLGPKERIGTWFVYNSFLPALFGLIFFVGLFFFSSFLPFFKEDDRDGVGGVPPRPYLSPHTFVQTFVSAVESSVIVDSTVIVVSFVATVAFGFVVATFFCLRLPFLLFLSFLFSSCTFGV